MSIISQFKASYLVQSVDYQGTIDTKGLITKKIKQRIWYRAVTLVTIKPMGHYSILMICSQAVQGETLSNT